MLLAPVVCFAKLVVIGLRAGFLVYRTRAIITRGLYTFYPIFEGQKRFFKELFL